MKMMGAKVVPVKSGSRTQKVDVETPKRTDIKHQRGCVIVKSNPIRNVPPQFELQDAVNEALRDWVTNVRTTHYIIGR